MRGIWWGRRQENGIWIASKSRTGRKFRRFMTPFSGHDSFYLAAGRVRARIVVRNLES